MPTPRARLERGIEEVEAALRIARSADVRDLLEILLREKREALAKLGAADSSSSHS